jgi:hypothetical protein
VLRLDLALDEIEDPEQSRLPDQAWVAEWSKCLLNRVWATIENHQNHSPDKLYYTALRLSAAARSR